MNCPECGKPMMRLENPEETEEGANFQCNHCYTRWLIVACSWEE